MRFFLPGVFVTHGQRKWAVSSPPPDHSHHFFFFLYNLISHLQVHPAALTSMLSSCSDLARLHSYFASSPPFTSGRRLELVEVRTQVRHRPPVLLPVERPGRVDEMDRCCIERPCHSDTLLPYSWGREEGWAGGWWIGLTSEGWGISINYIIRSFQTVIWIEFILIHATIYMGGRFYIWVIKSLFCLINQLFF